MENLPEKARLRVKSDANAAWGMQETLLALLVNSLNMLMYGMSDPRKRGRRPDPIGPSWLKGEDGRTLPARVLPLSELLSELEKHREEANG